MNRQTRLLMLCLALIPAMQGLCVEHPVLESLIETPNRTTAEVQTGLIYDDGEADNGFRVDGLNVIEFAMRFDAPSATSQLIALAVCLQRLPGDAASGPIGINVYQDGGSGPGALIEAFTGNVVNVAATTSGSFHIFDVSSFDVDVAQRFYVAVELDREDNDFFLCADFDGVAGNRPVFASVNFGPWTNARSDEPQLKAWMIRAVVDDGVVDGPEPCDAGGDAIFLLGDRFRVDACWRTAGNSGTAKLAVEQGTGATMWFFNSNNPELFIKVRDACVDPFNRHWVFIAGLTNVEVTVTVTDTVTGFTKTYFNPLNMPFESVQDTSAFATCP